MAEIIIATTAIAALIVTLVTWILQSRTHVRHMKAQASANLTARLNEFNQAEIDHPEVYDFYDQIFQEHNKENHNAMILIDMRFAVFEDAFMQFNKYKTMDADSWGVWLNLIEWWVYKQFFEGYWKEAKPFFHRHFADLIDGLVNKKSVSKNEN